MHFVSEKPIPSISVPTALFNETGFTLRQRQAMKRLASLEYYVNNSIAPYYIYMNDDTVLWVRNLRYLFDEIENRDLSPSSKFVWGNCMHAGPMLLQGGSYFISRAAAIYLVPIVRVWVWQVTDSEDAVFESALEAIGLSASAGNSPYILGQYLFCPNSVPMDAMNFAAFPACPSVMPRLRRACAPPFLAQYNHLVLLHRLTGCNFRRPPIPPYKYPDTLYWTMGSSFPMFCIMNATLALQI
jgi:hypothetical protein